MEKSLSKSSYQSGWLRAYESLKSEEPLWDERPVPFLDRHLVDLGITNGARVLEVGCGEGRNSAPLLASECMLIGFDLSKIALKRAQVRAEGVNRKYSSLISGDIEALPDPFLEETFDAIVCLDVFGQLFHAASVAEAFQRLLSPGGRLLLNVYTSKDATYGEGEKLDEMNFLYKDTLFRYYTEDSLSSLFLDFSTVSIEHEEWTDPPHPGYRELEHTHDSLILLATK